MENVIKKIIEIDSAATERLRQAELEKEEAINKIKSTCIEIRQKMLDDTQKEIAEANSRMSLESDGEIKDILTKKDEEIKKLTEKFQRHHSQIEDSIFNTIFGIVG